MATVTRTGHPNLTTQELFGVVKMFDLGGQVKDATLYFGRGDVKFGRTRKPYTLASVALVTPQRFIPVDIFGWHWPQIPADTQVTLHGFTIN